MTAAPAKRWRTASGLAILLLGLLVVGLHLSGIQGDWIEMLQQMRENPTMIVTATVIYALCLAIPYVPGVELGLMLMIVFGRPGVLMAYAGTVVGLSLAFALGRVLSTHLLDSPSLSRLRQRARHFRRDGAAQLQTSRLGQWLQPKLARFRGSYPYLLVGSLFNLPGNWLIGGGGGIALVGGLSGRLHWLPFLATVMLATAGIPLLVWFGLINLERWLPAFAVPS